MSDTSSTGALKRTSLNVYGADIFNCSRQRSDIIIIATAHKTYKQLDYRGKLVVDIWNLRGKGRSIGGS
jgi:hypothetical protein